MRLSIDKLLLDNQAYVDELKRKTADILPNAACYDDIFLLRYVLSHKNRGGMQAAVDAVRKTIAWRTENAVLLEKIALTGKAPHEDIALNFNTAGYACDLGGLEPLWVVRTGHCNAKGLMSSLTIEQAKDWMYYSKEPFYHLCDERTRKTRTLIKVSNPHSVSLRIH
jgi:hypothetical protein